MKQKIWILLISILIILTASSTISAAEKKVCRHCSQEIKKLFIKVNNFYFHPSHFICYRCQSTIEGTSYYYENDRFYDDSCYQIANRVLCSYCSKDIKGRYTIYENNNYHKSCYEIVSALPCYFCKENITDSYITYENNNYHDLCYSNNIALRCSLCSKVIDKDYFYDRYKNNYHISHKQDSESCSYCGGYFNNRSQKKGFVYSDGRGICTNCSKDAIINMADVEPLLVEVNEKLKLYALDIPLDKVSIHLVNKIDLDRLMINKISNAQGYTTFYQKKNMLGMTLKREINVYLLFGVPRMSMIKIIAHEFNHVWQGLHSSHEIKGAFCEGSSNYVSYLVLQQYTETEAEHLIDNLFKDSDPEYGEGFRRVVRFVEEQGFDSWITRLKKHTSFPDRY